MKNLSNIIFICFILVAGFFYRVQLKNIWAQSFTYYFPCKVAITYDIAEFDTRFGISKEDFKKAISDAENVWEKPLTKNLFQYKEGGTLKINLIYDSRQESTVTLKNMGIVVQNNRSSYDSLKAKYDALVISYAQEKAQFQADLARFEIQKKAYETEVTQINRRGGATKQEYTRLNNEKALLDQAIAKINQEQVSLNNTVENINAMASTLNDLATKLNIDVKKFNTVGSALGGEFDEGVYKSGADGQEIDIYQFDNRAKLVRVLAHELGHALGLEHVDDTKAIMYRLNNGYNETPTATDLTQLKNLCGIK